LIKNSQPLGKNFQKTLGGIFLTHTVDAKQYRANNTTLFHTILSNKFTRAHTILWNTHYVTSVHVKKQT